jgi:hypothetical protein
MSTSIKLLLAHKENKGTEKNVALSFGVNPKSIFKIPVALSSAVIVASGDSLVLIYYNQHHSPRECTPGLSGTTVNPSGARYLA